MLSDIPAQLQESVCVCVMHADVVNWASLVQTARSDQRNTKLHRNFNC